MHINEMRQCEGDSRLSRIIAFISGFNDSLARRGAEVLMGEGQLESWRKQIQFTDLENNGGPRLTLWDSQQSSHTHQLIRPAPSHAKRPPTPPSPRTHSLPSSHPCRFASVSSLPSQSSASFWRLINCTTSPVMTSPCGKNNGAQMGATTATTTPLR